MARNPNRRSKGRKKKKPISHKNGKPYTGKDRPYKREKTLIRLSK